MNMQELTPGEVAKAKQLKDRGYSYDDIGFCLHVAATTICRYLGMDDRPAEPRRRTRKVSS